MKSKIHAIILILTIFAISYTFEFIGKPQNVKIITACVFLIIFLVLFIKYRIDLRLLKKVTTVDRGTRSERKLIIDLLKFGIQSDCIFHDLYIETKAYNYSQSDVVILTDIGIIVFEVKEYKGWLYGNNDRTYWTQTLKNNHNYKKYKFYNPLKQNNGHIEAIKNKLSQHSNIPYYSIIVFYGSCTIKHLDPIPINNFVIYGNELSKLLKTLMKNNGTINYNKAEVANTLKDAVNLGSCPTIKSQHICNIKQWS